MYEIEITKYQTKTRTINDKTVVVETTGKYPNDTTKKELVPPYEEEYQVCDKVLSIKVDDIDMKAVIDAIMSLGEK